MKLVLVAVGSRVADWADAAFESYAKRFPPELPLLLKAVKAEPRDGRARPALLAAEAKRIEAALPRGSLRVALDERGERLTTRELSARLQSWQRDGRDVAFIAGGPDGLDAAVQARCEATLRLSDLTLPHALVRVVVAEALYRAWSLSAGHPYHRE